MLIAVGYVGLYAGFAHANARSPTRRDPQVMFVLGATAQIVLTTAVMAPMTYVAAAINLPMQDSALLAADRAMGLDWAAYVHFVDDRPSLASWLNVGYAMIGWPLFAIPVVLAANRRYQRIEEFTFAFGVALAATTIISALVPAIGVYHEIGLDPASLKNINPGAYLDQLRDLPPTREGVLRHLELLGLGGIVTFPVFTLRLRCCSAGLCGRSAGCGRSRCWSTPPCWRRRRSMAAIISSTSSAAWWLLRWRSSRRGGSGRSSRAGKAASTSLRRCPLWFLRSKAGNRKRALRHQNQHDQYRGKPDLGLD